MILQDQTYACNTTSCDVSYRVFFFSFIHINVSVRSWMQCRPRHCDPVILTVKRLEVLFWSNCKWNGRKVRTKTDDWSTRFWNFHINYLCGREERTFITTQFVGFISPVTKKNVSGSSSCSPLILNSCTVSWIVWVTCNHINCVLTSQWKPLWLKIVKARRRSRLNSF